MAVLEAPPPQAETPYVKVGRMYVRYSSVFVSFVAGRSLIWLRSAAVLCFAVFRVLVKWADQLSLLSKRTPNI